MSKALPLKSILFVAANPTKEPRLRLDKEKREISEKLRLAGYGKVPINSIGAATPSDLQQALLDFKPQIVHFSGHGAGETGLYFEDAIGRRQVVKADALANLFRMFSRFGLECVVLNACYSDVQAKAIAQHIPFVIGMNQAIGDTAAIAFSVGFYRAVGAGEDFGFAHELGCAAIQVEGIAEHLTPVLYKNGELIWDSPPPPPIDEPSPISPRGEEGSSQEIQSICTDALNDDPIRLIRWSRNEGGITALFRERRRGWYYQLSLEENRKGNLSRVHRVATFFLPLLDPNEYMWAESTERATPEDWLALDDLMRLRLDFPESEIRLAGKFAIGEDVADQAMEEFGVYVPDEELLPAFLFVNKPKGLLLVSYFGDPDGFAQENLLCDDTTNECYVFESLKEAQESLEDKIQR